jgi:circadian clock protein KaiC
VLTFENEAKDYGSERRRMRIVKYRGVAFRGGFHDYKIVRGGIVIYPRLVAANSRVLEKREQIGSGLPRFDTQLGGGLESGSSTLIAGPPGTGKSSLASQFVHAALKRGERAAMFLFEESTNNLLNRSSALKLDLRGYMDSGALTIQQVDPAELSPGEFAHIVRQMALDGVRVVVIDSLNGFMNSMPDERLLSTHLHELLTFLGQRGVLTLLIGVQQGMLGNADSTSLDTSYLADNIIMLRYFESSGEVRQAIAVFKKRGGYHERSLRKFALTRKGIEVGNVLREFHGILTGVPQLAGMAVRGNGD